LHYPTNWFHSAPLTNLSVFVGICQPFILLCVCTKFSTEICVFVHSYCSQQRRANIRFCGLNPCQLRFSSQTSFLIVHTHLLRPKKASVFVNIHFQWHFCKPVFLCVFVRRNVNDFTKTEVYIYGFVHFALESPINLMYII